MKLFLAVLVLALTASCSQFTTSNRKTIKAKANANSPIDLNATSNPINGFNYYRLPPNAPTMGKQKSADNTMTTTTTTTTTVKKKKKIIIKK